MLLNSGSDFVKVNISNSRNDSVAFEVKISKALTIQQLKSKLEVITGGSASSMQIELYNGENLVMALHDDSQLVGALPIETGMRLHVTDNFNFIDYNVDKFDLTNEQYEQKHGTVRSFLKQNRLGKYNEKEMAELNEKRKIQKEKEEEHLKNINVGQRCQVTVVGNPIRRGTVMYKGCVGDKPNILIGVKYDEPLGKNDGSIDGKRYFDCQPKYGGFVAPLCVEVGDFPPEINEFDDEI